jgi:hypothetical protein
MHKLAYWPALNHATTEGESIIPNRATTQEENQSQMLKEKQH